MQLVKTAWRSFRSVDPVTVGDVFYSKLFFHHPQVKILFGVSKEEQSRKLIDMFNMIVGRLDRMHELRADVAALALRHVQYGVKPKHYKAVGEALLWTLQQGLGIDWTPAVSTAWEACYNELATAMIKAAYPQSDVHDRLPGAEGL